MKHGFGRILAAGLLLALFAIASGGEPVSVTTASADAIPSAALAASSVDVKGWIIGGHTLRNLIAHDPGGSDGVVTRTLDHPATFVTVTASDGRPAGWTATATQSFTSANCLMRAVRQLAPTRNCPGKLVPGVGAVLLDLEHWPMTPAGERQDPVTAYQKAASVAGNHSLKFIATPGVDLALDVPATQRQGRSNWDVYLNVLKLPEKIGADRNVDVFEVQSQSDEQHASSFASRLQAARAQAREHNKNVVVFGGISTNPNGDQTVTSRQMADAVRAAQGKVDRFWLNDPDTSEACQKCAADPGKAVEFLDLISPPIPA